MAAKFTNEQIAEFRRIQAGMKSTDPEVVKKAKEDWAKFIAENGELIRAATEANFSDVKSDKPKGDKKSKEKEGMSGWKKTACLVVGGAAVTGLAIYGYRHFMNGGEVEVPNVDIPTEG